MTYTIKLLWSSNKFHRFWTTINILQMYIKQKIKIKRILNSRYCFLFCNNVLATLWHLLTTGKYLNHLWLLIGDLASEQNECDENLVECPIHISSGNKLDFLFEIYSEQCRFFWSFRDLNHACGKSWPL